MSILVTGATGGIGSAIVEELRASGYAVFTQDIRATDHVTPDFVGDLLDTETLQRFVDECQERGVTSVIAAHGIAAAEAVAAITEDYLARTMLINTVSFIEMFEALEGMLTDANGAFIAISSQAGLVVEAGNGAYCASKFAVVGWAQARSRESKVRLRILCPGATETPLLRTAFVGMAAAQNITYEELVNRRTQNTPIGRLGQPAELARASRLLLEIQEPQLLISPVTGGEVLY